MKEENTKISAGISTGGEFSLFFKLSTRIIQI
jgi:hypothetical protein